MSGRLSELWPLIENIADRHSFDPDLVAAVVVTESAAQTGAARYEAKYRWLYRPIRSSRAPVPWKRKKSCKRPASA